MITIALNSGEEPAFHPGDAIEGSVSWEVLDDATDSLEVRLIWFTIGKGDRDAQFVDVKKVDSPAANGKVNFAFTAPHRPNSFSGKLIAVQWAVEVIAFPQRDAVQSLLTICPPTGVVVLNPVDDGDVFWKEWSFRPRKK